MSILLFTDRVAHLISKALKETQERLTVAGRAETAQQGSELCIMDSHPQHGH